MRSVDSRVESTRARFASVDGASSSGGSSVERAPGVVIAAGLASRTATLCRVKDILSLLTVSLRRREVVKYVARRARARLAII